LGAVRKQKRVITLNHYLLFSIAQLAGIDIAQKDKDMNYTVFEVCLPLIFV